MVDIIIILKDASGILIWFVCLIALVLILLQGGAGDISSAFGGGGQLDSSLGVGAHQKISKVTGWFVAIFLVLVVILSIPIKGELGAGETPVPDKTEKTMDEDADDVPVIDDGSEEPGNQTQPDADNSDAGAEAKPDNADGGAEIKPVDEAAQPEAENNDAADAGAAEIKPVEE